MSSFLPINAEGYYVPTTSIYDAQFIAEVDINSPEFKNFLVDVQNAITDHAEYINKRSSGRLNPTEEISGKTYFNPPATSLGANSYIPRQAYFVTVNVGPLMLGAVNVLHNIPAITGSFTCLRLYGAATNPTGPGFSWISLPYAGALGTISLEVTPTQLIITSSFDTSAYTRALVTIEYLKN